MKVKKDPMPFWQKIFYAISFVVLIGAFIFLGTRDYKIKSMTDEEIFTKEYKNISIPNYFSVFDSAEALTFLENGTGILFLGFPQNKWSAAMAEILDDLSREYEYSVHYFNFYDERESRHDNYLGILREVDQYLKVNDKGKLDLYAPTVLAVVKGDVVYFSDETNFMNYSMEPKDYWTESQIRKKMNELRDVFEKMKGLGKNESK